MQDENDSDDMNKDFVPSDTSSEHSDSDNEYEIKRKQRKVCREKLKKVKRNLCSALTQQVTEMPFPSCTPGVLTNLTEGNQATTKNSISIDNQGTNGKATTNTAITSQGQRFSYSKIGGTENSEIQNSANGEENIGVGMQTENVQSVLSEIVNTFNENEMAPVTNRQMGIFNVEREEEKENTTGIQQKKRARTVEERMLRLKIKHPLREPICQCKENKCMKNVSQKERTRIYEEFWNLNKHQQRIWLSTHVKETNAKRKVEGSRRNFSRVYMLGEENPQTVCQKFFLSALGYTSSTVIEFMLKACKDDHGNRRMLPIEDQRGRHIPVNKVSETPIKEHINSFKPRPSHYRRSHAPNRKYLPADLSIKTMHQDYLSNPNNKQISYEMYRRTLDKMNIGFYEVGADKCGYCVEMDLNPTDENLALKDKHLQQVRITREKYRADGDLANQNTNIKVFAADLQRVFLLPRMPKIKDSFFTSRLIVFNETFASLSKKGEHCCILWHETIAGRRT